MGGVARRDMGWRMVTNLGGFGKEGSRVSGLETGLLGDDSGIMESYMNCECRKVKRGNRDGINRRRIRSTNERQVNTGAQRKDNRLWNLHSKMRFWQNILLLFSAILAAMLVGEIGARLFLPDPFVAVVNTAPDFDGKLADEAREPITAQAKKNPSQGPLYVHSQTGRRLRANAHVIIENHNISGRRFAPTRSATAIQSCALRENESCSWAIRLRLAPS